MLWCRWCWPRHADKVDNDDGDADNVDDDGDDDEKHDNDCNDGEKHDDDCDDNDNGEKHDDDDDGEKHYDESQSVKRFSVKGRLTEDGKNWPKYPQTDYDDDDGYDDGYDDSNDVDPNILNPQTDEDVMSMAMMTMIMLTTHILTARKARYKVLPIVFFQIIWRLEFLI